MGAQMRSWYDPVHGLIQLGSEYAHADLEQILDSAPLTRLRHIKQLGYASYVYPMADHSRYSHALGTSHVASILARKILWESNDAAPFLKLLGEAFPLLAVPGDVRVALVEHVRAAALLQDVGELPYEAATRGLFRPTEGLREELQSWLPAGKSGLSDKQIFTLALVRLLDLEAGLQALDLQVVALLLSRGLPWEQADNPILIQLRNVLDSSLDADRIDYVYRDALVSIGAIGNPSQVIDSILTYRADQVVISNPAHVGSLLMARNHLYRSVYLNPEKRLRERALRGVLLEIENKPQSFGSWSPAPRPGEIELHDFLQLDDVSLLASINKIGFSTLSRQTQSFRWSINTLRDVSTTRYESVWVAPTQGAQPAHLPSLPAGVLADARDDYARVGSFNPGFFRIDPTSFVGGSEDQTIEAWIPEISRTNERPEPSTLLAFVPSNLDARSRRQFEAAKTDGSLYFALKREVSAGELRFPANTLEFRGFSDPAVHISWCWADLHEVRRCVAVLHRLRIKYKLLIDPFDGLGTTPSENSRQLVQTAPSLMVLASSNYIARLRDLPVGNLAEEMAVARTRTTSVEPLRSVVLALDDRQVVQREFPWLNVGGAEAPFLGRAAADCGNQELEELISNALIFLRRSNQQ